MYKVGAKNRQSNVFTPEVEYEVVGDSVSHKLDADLVNPSNAPDREPCIYSMALPIAGRPWNFPVKGCPGRSATRTATRVNLFYLHVRDTVIILNEGNLPNPR